MPDDDRYSLTELADLAGVTPRTIRYYLGQGLLPPVGQSGPRVRYGPGHLARLRVIRRLQVEHLPLAEIRRRFDALDDEAILELAGSEPAAPPMDSALDYLRSVLGGGGSRPTGALRDASGHDYALAPAGSASAPSHALDAGTERSGPAPGSTPSPASAAPSAAPIERSQWERIVLAQDIELHLRRPLSRPQNKQVDRLVTIAREILQEDQP